MSSSWCYVCRHSKQSALESGLSFHKAPRKASRKNILNAWLNFLHLPPSHAWPNKNWRDITLCSLHFNKDDYANRKSISGQTVYLKHNAVPSRNRPCGLDRFGNKSSSLVHVSNEESATFKGSSCMVSENDDSPAPSSSVETRAVEEDDMNASSSALLSPLIMPRTPTRGIVSKLHLAKDGNLRSLPSNKSLTPYRKRMYEVAKFYKTKYLQKLRKRLVMIPLSTSENRNDTDLFEELYTVFHLNSQNSVNLRRHATRIKALSLAFQRSSNAAYRLLSQMSLLPSPRTLNRLHLSVPFSTGISRVMLDAIAKQIPAMSEIDKICVLMFDEIRLDKHLHYERDEDHILGYEDVGGRRSPNFAAHSLVFMACGLMTEWKHPIGFHFTQLMSQLDLENAVEKTVLQLQGVGLKIVAIVCDMAQANISALQSLAIKTNPQGDESCIILGNDRICLFADPPNLLKILRNHFLKFDIQFQGRDGKIKLAKFNILEEFLEHEKKKVWSYVYGHKIQECHLDPNSKEKMEVELASELFSVTVARGLEQFAKLKNNEDAYSLAEFVEYVNDLFDSFNAHPKDNKAFFRQTVTDRSCHHKFWIHAFRNLAEWKFVVRSPIDRLPESKCFHFWRRNVIAVQYLWKEVKGLGAKCLKTRNVNKDPLESLFGRVRQHGGCNTNPSCKSFFDSFKIQCVNSLALKMTSKGGNVLKADLAFLTDLLNSPSGEQDITFDRNGTRVESSTSLGFACSASKEVKACTNWISKFPCNYDTVGGSGSAVHLLHSFLRIKSNFHFLCSCFDCFRCVYLCTHPTPTPGRLVCDVCSSLNSNLDTEMLKIYIFALNFLQKEGHKSLLTKRLMGGVSCHVAQHLSCKDHSKQLLELFQNFIIDKAIHTFCKNVNFALKALSKREKPQK